MPQGLQPFIIEQAAANYHPAYGRRLFIQLVFDTLFVNGPNLGQNGSVIVKTLPPEEWTQLKDVNGQPLPAAVLLTNTGQLFGSWLPVAERPIG
jgi:hypothetical protein